MIGRSGRLLSGLLVSAALSFGYTVLTHEAIIDSVWDASLQKLLLQRFPDSTPEQLEEAHAYAYGGCIIQDAGYYPFSSRFFSDLTHYVRSGDFVSALLRESQDLNEYAFALGALEHYAADTEGHRIATNKAVPMLYPKLQRKFGKEVTYWDNPVAHARTEFGFDVLQVVAGRYAPEHYKKFIGFEVSKAVLERAFLDTYGIAMKDVFASVDLGLGSYRYGVSSIVPSMTRVAWSLKRVHLQKEIPGITRKKFLYNLSRSTYEKNWGTEYHKPGIGTRILASVFAILPATGPFSALRIRTPTPEVEKLFMDSFNATIDRYKALLAGAGIAGFELKNENLDAAAATIAGKYKGTDKAYARLLGKLADRHFDSVTPKLRQNILAYYKDLHPAVSAGSTRQERESQARVLIEIDQLKALPAEVGATQ